MPLAPTPDDEPCIDDLTSTQMDPLAPVDQRKLGPLLIRAAIPEPFANLHKLAQGLGVAYSTVHAWSRGTSQPQWDHVCTVAELAGTTPEAIVRGAEPSHELRAHPGWPEAAAAATARWPGRWSAATLERVGRVTLPERPARLDEMLVFELAQIVDQYLAAPVPLETPANEPTEASETKRRAFTGRR